MTGITDERKKSGKLTLKYLSDQGNRARLRKTGIMPTTPVVVCEWETPVSEVLSMLRVQDGSSKVLIAVRKDHAIYTLTASAETPDGVNYLTPKDMHPNSEIGMVYTALSARPRLENTPTAAPGRQLGQYLLTPA